MWLFSLQLIIRWSFVWASISIIWDLLYIIILTDRKYFDLLWNFCPNRKIGNFYGCRFEVTVLFYPWSKIGKICRLCSLNYGLLFDIFDSSDGLSRIVIGNVSMDDSNVCRVLSWIRLCFKDARKQGFQIVIAYRYTLLILFWKMLISKPILQPFHF